MNKDNNTRLPVLKSLFTIIWRILRNKGRKMKTLEFIVGGKRRQTNIIGEAIQ